MWLNDFLKFRQASKDERYLGAAIGATILTGTLPEMSQISGAVQFLGAFGLLVGMYILGLVNELI
jgi:hypothetical protein